MTFALLDQTETIAKQKPKSNIGLGNALQNIFKQDNPSVQGFLPKQQTQDNPFTNLPIRENDSFGIDISTLKGFDESEPRPVPFPDILSLNPRSESRSVTFPELSPLDPSRNPLSAFFEDSSQSQRPASPIRTLEDAFSINPPAGSANAPLDSFIKDLDVVQPIGNLSFDSIKKPLVGTNEFFGNPDETRLRTNVSFTPHERNDESLMGLFEPLSARQETALPDDAEISEQVAGRGFDILKEIGKRGLSKAKELFKRPVKPKQKNKELESPPQKGSLQNVEQISKDSIKNVSKNGIKKSINQAASAIAIWSGISKNSENYRELTKDLLENWQDGHHPKYTPVTNPNTGTKEFGEIKKEVTDEIQRRKKIKISPGRIRLPVGHDKIGKIKLEKKHLRQYKEAEFNTVEEYVNFVGKSYSEIYQEKKTGRIIVVKRNGKENSLILELSPVEPHVYNVISGFPELPGRIVRRVKSGRYIPLWSK